MNKSKGERSAGVHICWFLLVILVAGAFVSTLANISKGLNEQLVFCKDNLINLKDQLTIVSEERSILLDKEKDEEIKSHRLREKSQFILEELLSQQNKIKALQYELLAAKNEINGIVSNSTGSSSDLMTRFNLTLDVLKEKVTSNIQYKSLFKRSLEDKIRLEGTVETMQFTVFNLTKQLENTKLELMQAEEKLRQQDQDIVKMSEQVAKANAAMSNAASLLKSREG